MQDFHISTSREETFLVGCQKTPDTCPYVQGLNEKTEKKSTRTASCTIASLQRVKESWWQLQTESRQTREQDTSTKSHKEGEKIFRETMNILTKQREGPNGQHLADLPSAALQAARA